jgi:hypothetical protein
VPVAKKEFSPSALSRRYSSTNTRWVAVSPSMSITLSALTWPISQADWPAAVRPAASCSRPTFLLPLLPDS